MTSPDCQNCERKEAETVEHMLCRCDALEAEREALVGLVGHTNMMQLMTTDADVVTKWMLCFCSLSEFAHDDPPRGFLPQLVAQRGEMLRAPAVVKPAVATP